MIFFKLMDEIDMQKANIMARKSKILSTDYMPDSLYLYPESHVVSALVSLICFLSPFIPWNQGI